MYKMQKEEVKIYQARSIEKDLHPIKLQYAEF